MTAFDDHADASVLGLPAERLERLENQYQTLGSARQWRTGRPWIASARSTDLFQMEYFRHLQEAEGSNVSAGGFLKMLIGDETDALILAVFLRPAVSRLCLSTKCCSAKMKTPAMAACASLQPARSPKATTWTLPRPCPKST